MLAVFTDELTRASGELCEPEGASQHSCYHLESQAALIAQGSSPGEYSPGRLLPERSNHRVFASDGIRQNVLKQLEATFCIGRDWLEAKERCTRRKEFAGFQEKQPISATEGKKAMKIYQQFGGWVEEKLLLINSVVSLNTLCHPKFATVVEQLGEMPNLTKEFVKNLIKEVRDAARAEQRKKQQANSDSGWRHDLSGGGRHYQLPPMYNEEAAMKVEALATERGVRAITIVEEAIAVYGETASSVIGGSIPPVNSRLKTGFPSQVTANPKGQQPASSELRHQHQEELQAVVSEVRSEHVQMQRKLIERDARIAEIEQLAQMPVLEPVEHNFSTWSEFADTVVCDRATLLNKVKPWSLQKRQSLSTLLADYLREEQDALDQVTWVPDKLLNSALSKLSFRVSKISGPDNMVDEPEIEEISSCRFVSVQHLGIRRPSGDARRLANASLSPVATLGQSPRPHWTHRERWVFEGYGGRMLTVFSRDEFRIE